MIGPSDCGRRLSISTMGPARTELTAAGAAAPSTSAPFCAVFDTFSENTCRYESCIRSYVVTLVSTC